MTKDEFNLFFETFKPNNSYFECRILNTGKGVLSGYFNDTEKLSRAINRYNGKYNIFFTLNELDENIVARSQNRLSVWSKHTTTDAEIIRRKWVLIDLDPVRPSGIASTSKELGKAEALADKIVDFLYKEGFPEAVRAMSGNGHHILLPVDLPNDPDITKLIKDFLLVLDSMFSTAEVNVDVSTYNPARITKLYGTIACKGDSTKDRPHRKSYIISMPNTTEPVSMDLLKKVVSEYGTSVQRQEKTIPSKNVRHRSKKVVNVKEFCQNHGIEISHVKNWNNDGICYVLSTCPWNPEHTDKSGYIIEFPNGKIIAGCHHDSCNEETWETLLAKYHDTSEFSSLSKNDEDEKMSRVEILLNDIKEAGHTLYHDSSENAYVSVPLKNGCKEYMKLRDKRYSQMLRKRTILGCTP